MLEIFLWVGSVACLSRSRSRPGKAKVRGNTGEEGAAQQGSSSLENEINQSIAKWSLSICINQRNAGRRTLNRCSTGCNETLHGSCRTCLLFFFLSSLFFPCRSTSAKVAGHPGSNLQLILFLGPGKMKPTGPNDPPGTNHVSFRPVFVRILFAPFVTEHTPSGTYFSRQPP